MRANGAIEGAAAGFAEGDEVIVLKKHDNSVIKVIGHTDGIRRCEEEYEYYFIHNFETAVDQPDYVWDMKEPDNYVFDYYRSSLTSDAKFGNYGLQLGDFLVNYTSNDPDNLDFDTPYTLEYWFKSSPPTGLDPYFILAWGATWSYGVYQLLLYRNTGEGQGKPTEFRRWIRDIDGNELVNDTTTTIPFSYSEWHHFAMVLTDNKLRYYFDGIKHDEFTSPSPTGFKGRLGEGGTYRDIWWYIYIAKHNNFPGDLKVIIDALSITKGEKYTENFTPPTEPPSA